MSDDYESQQRRQREEAEAQERQAELNRSIVRQQEEFQAATKRANEAAEQNHRNTQAGWAGGSGWSNPYQHDEEATRHYDSGRAFYSPPPPPPPPPPPSYVFSPPPPVYSPPAYEPSEPSPPTVPFTHTRRPASPPTPSRPRAAPPVQVQQQRPQPRAAIAERERCEKPAWRKRRSSGVGGFLFALLIIGGIGFAVLRFLPGEIVPTAPPQSAASFVVEPFTPQSPRTPRSERVVIRSGPGQSNATLMTATPGEELPIIGRVRAHDGVWFALALPNGRAGYIAERVTMPLGASSAPDRGGGAEGGLQAVSGAVAPAARPASATAVSDFISDPVWLRRPAPEALSGYYPNAALTRGIGGEVVLRCRVQIDGFLSCMVSSETPRGRGFGDAALRFSGEFQSSARAGDGSSTVGRTIDLPIRFEVAD